MNTNKQYVKSLTPHAERVLEILRQADHPLTRTELAQALGKRNLTPWDVGVLDMLSDELGLVEVDSRPVQVEFSYRIAE